VSQLEVLVGGSETAALGHVPQQALSSSSHARRKHAADIPALSHRFASRHDAVGTFGSM